MFLRLKLFLLSILLFGSAIAEARVLYGVEIPEQLLTQQYKARQQQNDTLNPFLSVSKVSDYRLKEHHYQDDSSSFLVFMLLFGFIAGFKAINPVFFRNVFRAFRNPNLTSRQLKEQLRQDSAPSLTLDLIFCVSAGAYIYYVLLHVAKSGLDTRLPHSLLLLALILLLIVVYAVRFSFLRFVGWAFNIEEATDAYSANVFLINKILGIALIPFTLVLAFGKGFWVDVCLVLSFILIGVLMFNRFVRSSVTFGFFIKFSKFHFFMYLCASELLPLAVLIKLINQWLIN